MRIGRWFVLCLLALSAEATAWPQAPDINVQVAQIILGRSTLEDVIRVFGEPATYFWGDQVFSRDSLPSTYIAAYPDRLMALIDRARVVELEVCDPAFVLLGKLQVGWALEDVLDALGRPTRTVKSEALPERPTGFVLYEDIGGLEGAGYYSRPDVGVHMVFSERKLSALHLVSKNSRGARELKSIPKFNPESQDAFQVDLRNANLSGLDLTDKLEDLLYAAFDDRTIWPPDHRMPKWFDRQRIMELGMNPGLGVHNLHKSGITGRRVSIALIDQVLPVEHQEFASRLHQLEPINVAPGSFAMHGAAVVSIAAGVLTGVAPEAEIFFVPVWSTDAQGTNHSFRAQAVRRLLEVNAQLPADQKIRVISMSVGWSPTDRGYQELTEAAEEAKAAGMLFVCSSIERVHGLKFQALGRPPLADPDAFESYEPGLFWALNFYRGERFSDRLLAPMDSRTTASPYGDGEYVFYRMGGWSWTIPYLAGVFALAVQADPSITPEGFWSLAMKTGRIIELKHQGETIPFGPIIDPVALISELRRD